MSKPPDRKLLIFLLFLNCIKWYMASEEQCQALHANGFGITVICCGKSAKLPDNCEFSRTPWCLSSACHCQISVDLKNLNCTHNPHAPVFHWLDHKSLKNHSEFPCRRPNFPNTAYAFFDLKADISPRNEALFRALIRGMRPYAVTSIDLTFSADSWRVYPEDFLTHFPLTRFLSLRSAPALTGGANPARKTISLLERVPFLAKSDNLEVLTVRDLPKLTSDGLFNHPARANYQPKLPKLRRLSLDGCSKLERLPLTLADSSFLDHVSIKGSSVENISVFQTHPSLRTLLLQHNKVTKIHKLAFSCPKLRDLDLSHNLIGKLTAKIFENLPQLAFLDLSHNPLRILPDEKMFINLRSLKWLRLNNAGIKHLGAPNLLGLSTLQDLSLQGNPKMKLDPFAFIHLHVLETLDLRNCSLTEIPEAVTQACELKHLWLSFNLLHSTEALPGESVVQLSELRQLVLSENPLQSTPESLFLLPRQNQRLMESLLRSMQQVPAWWRDHCTPFLWWLHLVEGPVDSKAREVYRKLFSEPPARRLSKRRRSRCVKRYQHTLEDLQLYRPILTASRCENVRKMRSFAALSTKPPHQTTVKHTNTTTINWLDSLASSELENNETVVEMNVKKREDFCSGAKLLLLLSLMMNSIIVIGLVLFCAVRFTKKAVEGAET